MDTVMVLWTNVVMGNSSGQTNRERRGDAAWNGPDRKKKSHGTLWIHSVLHCETAHWS